MLYRLIRHVIIDRDRQPKEVWGIDRPAANLPTVPSPKSTDKDDPLRQEPCSPLLTFQDGRFVTWKGRTMSCKDDDTLDTLIPKLRELMNSVDHCVGPFKIKSGPYGLYMFKCQGQGQGKGKPKFVSIPSDTSYTTLTIEGADALYKHCCSIKKGKRG